MKNFAVSLDSHAFLLLRFSIVTRLPWPDDFAEYLLIATFYSLIPLPDFPFLNTLCQIF